MSDPVTDYITAHPHIAAMTDLRATLADLLPDHMECMSYAMPGFRHPSGKMTIGYAAYARHIGVYPHSGQVMAKIDCHPYKTSKSGLTFGPDAPPPRDLLARIIAQRLADIAALSH